MNELKGSFNNITMPIESIKNKLMELRESEIENCKISDTIKYKLFNPEPCNPTSGSNESCDTIESIINDIRMLSREATCTLNDINSRL